jgi:hypothetical protein
MRRRKIGFLAKSIGMNFGALLGAMGPSMRNGWQHGKPRMMMGHGCARRRLDSRKKGSGSEKWLKTSWVIYPSRFIDTTHHATMDRF